MEIRYLKYITITIVAIFILHHLLQYGMFLDGITYAAIAKNMANGLGSFWHPMFTQTIDKQFYSHPPLGIGIQAIFFYILGDSHFTELIYAIINTALSVIAISLVWKVVVSSQQHKKIWFLPVFIWICIPIVFWSFTNNILENTLHYLGLFAVYFLIIASQKSQCKYALISSFFITAALLVKGPVGLFPIIVPFIFTLCFKSNSILDAIKIMSSSFMGIVILLGALYWLQPDMHANLEAYFKIQLLPSLNSKIIENQSRFYIIKSLLKELIVPAIIVVVFYFLSRYKNWKWSFEYKQELLFLILIGLSACVPIIISGKQRDFYVLPSIPFYVMASCLIIAPVFNNYILPKLKWKSIKYTFVVILFLLCLDSLYVFNRDKTDSNIIPDLKVLKSYFGKQTIVSVDSAFVHEYKLTSYLNRFSNISVDPFEMHEYYLSIQNQSNKFKDFNAVSADLQYFKLWKKPE
jgi:4-amino-4-deoxy-L-arabinose transferase-like glycosyltransferase